MDGVYMGPVASVLLKVPIHNSYTNTSNVVTLQMQIEANVQSGDQISIDDITFENCDLDQDWPCEYQCSNKVCIPESRLCDFSDDCGNQQDETGCGMRSINS